MPQDTWLLDRLAPHAEKVVASKSSVAQPAKSEDDDSGFDSIQADIGRQSGSRQQVNQKLLNALKGNLGHLDFFSMASLRSGELPEKNSAT